MHLPWEEFYEGNIHCDCCQRVQAIQFACYQKQNKSNQTWDNLKTKFQNIQIIAFLSISNSKLCVLLQSQSVMWIKVAVETAQPLDSVLHAALNKF